MFHLAEILIQGLSSNSLKSAIAGNRAAKFELRAVQGWTQGHTCNPGTQNAEVKDCFRPRPAWATVRLSQRNQEVCLTLSSLFQLLQSHC